MSEAVDWTAANAGGADAGTVFETVDGAGLDTVRVDRLYTYNGFHNLFLGRLGTIADQLENESWVLGKFAEKTSLKNQYPPRWENVSAEAAFDHEINLSKRGHGSGGYPPAAAPKVGALFGFVDC